MMRLRSLLAAARAERAADPRTVPAARLDLPQGPCRVLFDRHNRRVKFVGPAPADVDSAWLAAVAGELGGGSDPFTKLILYVRGGEGAAPPTGCVREAVLPGFFGGTEAATIWSYFIDPARAVPADAPALDRCLALSRARRVEAPVLPAAYGARGATAADAGLLSAHLGATFSDYPTPLAADYLAGRIAAGTSRFELVNDPAGDLAATVSAELDTALGNAEISDCATVPAHRGRGLSRYLIRRVEETVAAATGIRAFYTLCRGLEPGVNVAFARCGYAYSGRLVGNCRMPDGWETMHAWCRLRG